MKRTKFLYGIVAIAMLNAVSLIAAEAPKGAPLSLDQALRIAYLDNPQMIEARKDIAASKGRWIQAEALPNPELGLSLGGLKSQTKDEKEVRDGNLDSFTIKQPLDPLGARFLRGRMAWDEVKIAKGESELVWAEVRRSVIGLYSGILAAEKNLETAKDNLNVSRQFFTSVETKFQSGSALQSDVLRAKIEVSRSENDLLIAEKNLKVLKGQLNLALGRLVESELSLSDSLTYEGLRYRYEEITGAAVSQRADVKNQSRRLSSAKKGFWSALIKTFFPNMAIGVERTTEDFENDTALILEASYPLWGFNFGEVKEAKAEKEKHQVRLEALKRQVGLEVYESFLEAELADKQVAIQKKSIEEANELLRQITLRYEEGEVPFLTYLENIKTIKETRLAYFQALKNYREKIAELERIIQATPIPKGVES